MALCHYKQEGKLSLRCIWYNKVQLDPFSRLAQSIFCLSVLIQIGKLCIPSERLSQTPWRWCCAYGLTKSLKQSLFFREAEVDPGHGAQRGADVAWSQMKNILWSEDCTRTRIWGCLKPWWSPWVQRWLWPRFQAKPGQSSHRRHPCPIPGCDSLLRLQQCRLPGTASSCPLDLTWSFANST